MKWDSNTKIQLKKFVTEKLLNQKIIIKVGDIITLTISDIEVDTIIRDCFKKWKLLNDDYILMHQICANGVRIRLDTYARITHMMNSITINFEALSLKIIA